MKSCRLLVCLFCLYNDDCKETPTKTSLWKMAKLRQGIWFGWFTHSKKTKDRLKQQHGPPPFQTPDHHHHATQTKKGRFTRTYTDRKWGETKPSLFLCCRWRSWSRTNSQPSLRPQQGFGQTTSHRVVVLQERIGVFHAPAKKSARNQETHSTWVVRPVERRSF